MESQGLVSDIWTALFGASQKKDLSLTAEVFDYDPMSQVGSMWDSIIGGVESPNFRDRTGFELVMEPPKNDPYERDYEQILAIQQKGSKGFRTFDIDPFLITQTDYPCQIANSVLGNLFGFQDGMRQFAAGVDTDVAPFFRTVEIVANATWVRFEMLPPRLNDKFRGNVGAFPTGPVIEGQSWGPVFPDTGTGRTTIDANEVGAYSVNQNIVVQFESPDSSPLIVKHGDTFKVPFNVMFVTFKQWTHRFRIVVGYNTEAESFDNRLLATRPAFHGVGGFLNASEVHFTPFSITSGDLNGTFANTLATQEAVGLRSDTLIRNRVPSGNGGGYDHGSSYLWIRRLHVSGRTLVTSARDVSVTWGLYVYGPISLGGATARKRRLVNLSKTYNTETAAGVDQDVNFDVEFSSDELVRVRLGYGDELRLVSFIEQRGFVNTIVYWQFELEGYVLGGLEGQPLAIALTPITPFDCTLQLSEEQYPLDYLWENSPGAQL